MSLVMIVLWLFQLVTFQKSLVELMSKITVADPMFVRYVYNSQRLLTQSQQSGPMFMRYVYNLYYTAATVPGQLGKE